MITSLGCKDEIPSMCDVNPESPLASCSQITAYGENLGMTLECMCDIYWRDIDEPTLFKSSCDSMTPGQIKDNCQASCNMCQATGKVFLFLKCTIFIRLFLQKYKVICSNMFHMCQRRAMTASRTRAKRRWTVVDLALLA